MKRWLALAALLVGCAPSGHTGDGRRTRPDASPSPGSEALADMAVAGDGGAHDAGGKDASAADSGARIDDAGHIGDSGLIRDASTEDAGGGDGGTSDGSVVSCSSTGLAQAPTSFALPPGYSNTSGETFPSLYDPWGATSF